MSKLMELRRTRDKLQAFSAYVLVATSACAGGVFVLVMEIPTTTASILIGGLCACGGLAVAKTATRELVAVEKKLEQIEALYKSKEPT